MAYELEFEQHVRQLAAELERRQRSDGDGDARRVEIERAIEAELARVYQRLTPWQTVQVARHRDRPYTLDYAKWAFSEFIELHGDRHFGDDPAIVGGPALLDGRSVMLIGHQKGRDTPGNLQRNFGMPHPEGYRKAIRLCEQADRLDLPVITLVDSPGANPSLPAEERGQAQSIAESIATLLKLHVPTISVITGEGGSGGALALAVTDRILMLEHAIFTVASPEAAASILWRDSSKAADAAAAMKITAMDLHALGVVDVIVAEPTGGAHRDHAAAARTLQQSIVATLAELDRLDTGTRLRRRHNKYRHIGAVSE